MSVLVAYNYTASEALEQGVAIAFDAITTEFNERKVHKASDTETIVGVAAQTVSAGQSVSVISFVVGQSFKVRVGENVSRGNALGMRHGGDDGVFYKHDGYGLLAMDDCAAGDLVEAVCVKENLGAVGGDLSVYGDLELAAGSVIAWNDKDISAPSLSGPIGTDVGQITHKRTGGGSSTFSVGAITLACFQGSSAMSLWPGDTLSGTYLTAAFVSWRTDINTLEVTTESGGQLTGTWKVLSGGGSTSSAVPLMLVQRIL